MPMLRVIGYSLAVEAGFSGDCGRVVVKQRRARLVPGLVTAYDFVGDPANSKWNAR